MKIKVFLSWSGTRSKDLAKAFSKWLPSVLNGVKSFYSADDITAGGRWNLRVANELEESKIGLLFLTTENLMAPWLMFEAGALSKNVGDSKVCPILFGVKPTDITGPLVQFQLAEFEQNQIKKVVKMINAELGEDAMEAENFEFSFKVWWPQLKRDIEDILINKQVEATISIRSDKELLEEILQLSRASAAVILGPSKEEGLEAAFRELSIHQQVFMFIDGIARQRTWTFYSPREGETELGTAIGQLVSGLIKSEKREVCRLVLEWLSSKNENLVYFAGEVIGYFNTEFKELKENVFAIFKDLDKNKAWNSSQLNSLWAYSRLTNYTILNDFLIETDNEENQRWMLVAFEQMVKAKDSDRMVEPIEFIPTLQSFVKSKASEHVKQKAQKILEDFNCIVSPTN